MNYFAPEPMTEEQRVREIYNIDSLPSGDLLFQKLQALEINLQKNHRIGNSDLVLIVRKAVTALIKSGAEWVGTGTSRICFTFPGSNIVIKVPFNSAGENASHREEQAFKDFQKWPQVCTPIADCSFVDFTSSFGMKLLVMEQLHEFPGSIIGLPDWVAGVDCGQVGYNSKQKLVAYDL